MNELIKVTYDNDRPAVSARDLHEFLEVGSEYSHWFKRMCEYGFTEGQDYSPFLTNRVDGLSGKPRQDAILTIDMAKELCMLQRNEKGKQARQYFIQLEKDWNSPEKVMARALQIANRKLQTLEAQAEEDRPKVLFADSVAASQTSILIFDLAKILKQNGVNIGGNRLFEWMRKKGYLVRRKGSDYNMPTQRSMELGLFEVKETSVSHSDGHISVNKTPKVTGKGQQYFINAFLGKGNAAKSEV
jgi:anti-repressor protein